MQFVVQGDYVQGITEERAREIALEVSQWAVQQNTAEAQHLASSRIEEFDEILLDRLNEFGLLDALKDPGFQFSLKRAQIGAASSEYRDDYHLLSELLVERVQHGNQRPVLAGIDRAVEVIDRIDPDALRGLTMIQVASSVTPLSGGIEAGLDVLDAVYAPVLADGPLPMGREWIDHLDILDAVRTDSVSTFKKFAEYFSAQLAGYVAVGVVSASPEERQGVDAFLEQGVNIDPVAHELKEGFSRLPFPSLNVLETRLSDLPGITDERKTNMLKAAREVFGLTETGDGTLQGLLMDHALSRPSIRAVAEWWDQVPTHLRATSVGRVLARANSQRCDVDRVIPDLPM